MSAEHERVLSVFELAHGLKLTVEEATMGRWVEGEVGRLQRPGSGHLYFTLKDETRDATIDCVMYKRDAFRFGAKMQEGARVQLRGRATFYPPRGRLQWIAEALRPAGQGALLEALQKLKERLVLEGLTASERKRPLPSDPRVVGVVTSRTGAAFYDICTVIGRRSKTRVLLAPAVVQGDGAARSILEALDLMERANPDVVILGRGGGSAEDLMAFNDERVVRRVAAYKVPIVSAVGHEIDFSLTDLVADARAATPSEAAEMVVPDSLERTRAVATRSRELLRAMNARLVRTRLHLDRIHRKIGDPRYLLAEHQQHLDELQRRLEMRARLSLRKTRERVETQNRRLHARHPRAVLAGARADLAPLRERLFGAMRRDVARHAADLGRSAAALQALSPLSILGRGFALATLPSGAAVRDATTLSAGDEVAIRVRRGTFSARVQKVLSDLENHAGFAHESAAVRTEDEEKT